MRSTLLFAVPFLVLVPIACGTAGDSTSAAGAPSGAGGETSGTVSGGTGGKTTSSSGTASTSTGGKTTSSSGTASSGTASTGSGTASTGSGTASTGSGTASTGSGTASTGSGTASTGSGTASTGSGTTSTGSGTTSTGSGTTSTGSGTASSGTATGGGVCAGYIDVVGLGGTEHFTSICQGAWGSSESTSAIGYHFAGGPFPGADEIDILGCNDTNATSAGIHFSARKAAAPGTFTDGDLSYVDGNGGTWGTTGEMYQVVITKLDAPGGVIEGTFSVKATGPADTTITLTGSFHVCRVADELAP